MLTRLQDVLNCELEMKEDEQVEQEGLRVNDHDLRDLVYALSAFAHAASNLDRRSIGGNEERMKEIFRCVNTHSNKLLRSPKVILHQKKLQFSCQFVHMNPVFEKCLS
jgi:hypothetical protein